MLAWRRNFDIFGNACEQEAFALVREASKRVLGLRPFDVQLIGISLEASPSLTNLFCSIWSSTIF